MKFLPCFFWILCCCNSGYGQSTQPVFAKKIKVILLGTFHYGETSDRNRTSFPDLFSATRQAELNQLSKDLGNRKPTRLFIEAPVNSQAKYDSLFGLYRVNLLTDTVLLRNEIEQIGFRLAKQQKMSNLVCADFRQELPYAAMEKFEKGIGADTTIKYPPFFSIPYPFTDTAKRLSLSRKKLSDYYIALNDTYHRQQNEFDYLHYALGYGYEDDYTGSEYTAAWYTRNLKIFTNILRALKPADNCIVVLFGAAHTHILRQFFENHPSFEVVDLQDVLGTGTAIMPAEKK